MKSALKFSMCLAVIVSAVALGGAGRALSAVFQAGPLTRQDDYLELQHSFHLWAFYSVVAIGITIWLWWTYRRQYNEK
jgi:hypothetical protein